MKPFKAFACLFAALMLLASVCTADDAKNSTRGRKPANGNATKESEETASDVVPPPGMVYVPPGVVSLGTTAAELGEIKGRLQLDVDGSDASVLNELIGKLDQKQEVHGFFIDTFEVTNAAYEIFVKATGHSAPPYFTITEAEQPGTTRKKKIASCPAGMESFPVVEVAYIDAAAYAKWAGKRVPTEVEWERAARGDDGRIFPWGNFWDDKEKAFYGEGKRGKELAAYRSDGNANSAEEGIGKPVKVGSFPSGASPFGVMDMAGNVWEWTSTKIAPHPHGFEDLNSAFGNVIKGGSCLNTKQVQRAAVRMYLDAGESNTAIGFRCVKLEKPGLDRLVHAYEELIPSFPPGSQPIGVIQDGVAMENARYDAEHGYPLGAESIGFAPIVSTSASDVNSLGRLAQKTDKLRAEYLLAVFHTDRGVENLGLEPGDYGVFFQTRDAKALEEYLKQKKEEAAAGEEGAKPEEGGEEGGKKDGILAPQKAGAKDAKKDAKSPKGAKGANGQEKGAPPAADAPGQEEAKPAEAVAPEEEEAPAGLPPYSESDRITFKDRRGVIRAEILNFNLKTQTGVSSALKASGLDLQMVIAIRPDFGTKTLEITIPLKIDRPL